MHLNQDLGGDLRFDQRDLEALCRDREPGTGEMTVMNHCYGIGRTLRRYADLPEDEPLAFAYEHVVPFTPGKVNGCDLNDGLPAFLTSIPSQAEAMAAAGFERPVAGGYGIHYVRRVLEDRDRWSPPLVRAGTLAFPAKSSVEYDRSFDFAAYARHLRELPERFQPVAVSIYWKDYLRGSHRCYEELGIPVFTCGHLFDPLFLYRFIDLCSRFRYTCSNGIASSYPLSVESGCQFFENPTGPVLEQRAVQGTPVRKTSLEAGSTFGSRLAEIAPFPPQDGLRAEQRRVAGELTGREHLLAPEAIRELQRWSRETLLARQDVTLGFVSRVEHAVLNRWLRRHIHNDGWAESGASLTPANHPGRSVLNLYLKVSPRVSPEGQVIQILVGGKPVFEGHGNPGLHRIALPMELVRNRPVTFRLSREASGADGQGRKVAFRFIGVGATAGMPGEPRMDPVKRGALPTEFAIPQGW